MGIFLGVGPLRKDFSPNIFEGLPELTSRTRIKEDGELSH